MPSLHDSEDRNKIKSRLQAIKPNATPKWGSMTVDQMMWHVGSTLELCLGTLPHGDEKSSAPPLPKPWLRAIVLSLPWPKGAPTLPSVKATNRYDLEAERARALQLIETFASRPLDGPWPVHPILGTMSGKQYSRLQAKHFNHHLTQFGV